MIIKCKVCKNDFQGLEGRIFCSHACTALYRHLTAPKNKIDTLLELFVKYVGKLPHGIESDLAKILGVTRERVRQRAEKMSLTTPNKQTFYCINDGVEIKRGTFCKSKCRETYNTKQILSKLPNVFTIDDFMQTNSHTYRGARNKMFYLKRGGFVKLFRKWGRGRPALYQKI